MRSVLQTQGESLPRSRRRLMDVMLAAGVVPGKPIICRYIYATVSAIGSANRPGLAHHPNAEEDQQMRVAVLGSGGIGGCPRGPLPQKGAAPPFHSPCGRPGGQNETPAPRGNPSRGCPPPVPQAAPATTPPP